MSGTLGTSRSRQKDCFLLVGGKQIATYLLKKYFSIPLLFRSFLFLSVPRHPAECVVVFRRGEVLPSIAEWTPLRLVIRWSSAQSPTPPYFDRPLCIFCVAVVFTSVLAPSLRRSVFFLFLFGIFFPGSFSALRCANHQVLGG